MGYGFAVSSLTQGFGRGEDCGVVEDEDVESLGGGAPIGCDPGGGFHAGTGGKLVSGVVGGGVVGGAVVGGAAGGGIGIGVIGVIGIGIGVGADEDEVEVKSLFLKSMLCSLEQPVLSRF